MKQRTSEPATAVKRMLVDGRLWRSSPVPHLHVSNPHNSYVGRVNADRIKLAV